MQYIDSLLNANKASPISLREKPYVWKRVCIKSMIRHNNDFFLEDEIENILNMVNIYDDILTDLALEIIITKFNINV